MRGNRIAEKNSGAQRRVKYWPFWSSLVNVVQIDIILEDIVLARTRNAHIPPKSMSQSDVSRIVGCGLRPDRTLQRRAMPYASLCVKILGKQWQAPIRNRLAFVLLASADLTGPALIPIARTNMALTYRYLREPHSKGAVREHRSAP